MKQTTSSRYNNLIQYINKLDSELFQLITGQRKQRASRILKTKDLAEAKDLERLNGFKRFLKLSDIKHLERYMSTHNITHIFSTFDKYMLENRINYNYHTSNSHYDELSKHNPLIT